MSMWCYQITKGDGTRYEFSFPTEESATESAEKTTEENPEWTVGEVTQQADSYVVLAPVSQTRKANGSTDILYNDGSIVNVSAS